MTTPDARHRPLLAGVSVQPIIILGAHRSGTTLLYQLLAETGGFTVVTAYHLLRYERLLTAYVAGRQAETQQALAAQMAALGIETRGIDHVRVTPDLPEEYGFAIKGQQLTPTTLPRFTELCQKVQVIAPMPKPLLLKNPADYSHFRYAKHCFPATKFIFIHRQPSHILSSQLRALNLLLHQYLPYHALLAPSYRAIWNSRFQLAMYRWLWRWGQRLWFWLLTNVLKYQTDVWLAHVESLPPRDYVNLRFEDLCARPNETLRHVVSHLGLDIPLKKDYRPFIQPRPPRLLESVSQQASYLARKFERYHHRWGY